MKFIDNHAARLLSELQAYVSRSEEICIAVAFVRESGVGLLVGALREAIDRGTKVRLLFGLDFALSEAKAINALMALGVDARAYSSRQSFHPKGYIFRVDGGLTAIIGSSNLSASGLTSGREWNVVFDGADAVMEEFTRLWESDEALAVTDVVLHRLDRRPPPIELQEYVDREDRFESVTPDAATSLPDEALRSPEANAGLHFRFLINHSFKRYGQMTVPSSQVSYQRLAEAGLGSGDLTIAFEEHRRLQGFMHSAKAGFGPYYQVRILGSLSHPLFELPVGARVVVSLEREGSGGNLVRIVRD